MYSGTSTLALARRKRCSFMCAHASQVCRVSAVSAGLLYGLTKSAYLKTFKVRTPCAWRRIATLACFPALRCSASLLAHAQLESSTGGTQGLSPLMCFSSKLCSSKTEV